MGVVGGIIAFLLIWWTVLFMVLPMRVKGVWEDDGKHAKGVERGAPVNPELWLKLKRTTWVTAIVWAVVFVIVSSGVISYDWR
ncbi:MAG: DUF1467 family protein [Pseudomonadota bacterium]